MIRTWFQHPNAPPITLLVTLSVAVNSKPLGLPLAFLMVSSANRVNPILRSIFRNSMKEKQFHCGGSVKFHPHQIQILIVFFVPRSPVCALSKSHSVDSFIDPLDSFLDLWEKQKKGGVRPCTKKG
jgi:hypothetical protein